MDWDDDPEADAQQWYTDNGTGVGINADYPDWIEANTPGAGAESAALGFKAPAAGTYVFYGKTQNLWGQNAVGFRVVQNGAEVHPVVFSQPLLL